MPDAAASFRIAASRPRTCLVASLPGGGSFDDADPAGSGLPSIETP
jgi:hypothetical protein